MLRFVAIFIFILCANVLCVCQMDSIFVDDRSRTYLVHLPGGYDGQDLPLIIAMHGGFGSAMNLQNQSLLSVKADEENFIVVYPEGVQSDFLNIRTWNAGVCCGYAAAQEIDDVKFIDHLLDTLINNFAIDTSRIYATGMSNGGYMSYRLACEIPERFAAIAPVASSMTMDICEPGLSVPIIHFHSFLDENVPYLGGIGNGVSNHYSPPLDSVLSVWSAKNECLIEKDTLVSSSEFTHVQWRDCLCNSQIELFITEDGGHSWPGGTVTSIGDPVSKIINANDLMWDFFQDHSRNCSTSIQDQTTEKIHIFPNPTSGAIEISSTGIQEVLLYDLNGRFLLDLSNADSIDLSSLQEGIYILLIHKKGTKYFQKIQLLR